MYCVIQRIENKRADIYGTPKKIIVSETSEDFNGASGPKYYYTYSEERFERPIRTAYKFSIHKSYRENGKVKKKQWILFTMGYYNILDTDPHDYISADRIEEIMEELNITSDELDDIIYKKFEQLSEEIEREFQQTEEYRVKQEQEKIISSYVKRKEAFEKKYGGDTYDYCYDVFGVLRNEKYLKELESTYEEQKTYRKGYSSYYENNNDNYNYDSSSYFNTKQSNYTEKEKEFLKIIYRAAAMKLHPDIKKDNGEGMKLLNKLKEDWGI